jgi:hypothetical protein
MFCPLVVNQLCGSLTVFVLNPAVGNFNGSLGALNYAVEWEKSSRANHNDV